MSATIAPSAHPQVIGLDGQTREWTDVFRVAYQPHHQHRNDRVAEYVVRRTHFDHHAQAHQDMASFPATCEGYTDAVTAVHWLRANVDHGYGVIDTVYSCGCRFNG